MVLNAPQLPYKQRRGKKNIPKHTVLSFSFYAIKITEPTYAYATYSASARAQFQLNPQHLQTKLFVMFPFSICLPKKTTTTKRNNRIFCLFFSLVLWSIPLVMFTLAWLRSIFSSAQCYYLLCAGCVEYILLVVCVCVCVFLFHFPL